MDELNIETQDAYIEDDKTSTNETTTESGDDVETLKAKIAEAEKTIKTLSIQKQKALEKAKKNVEVKEPQPTVDVSEITSLKERLDLRDFKDSHPDLDGEDIAEIREVAKAKGVPLEDALNSKVVQGYLTSKKQNKQIEDATPSSSRSPKGSDGKPLFHEGQDEASHKAAWEQYMKSQR